MFCGSIWFIPYLSTRGIREKFLISGELYQKVGDNGWSEYYGGQGVYSVLSKRSYHLQVLQDNNIKLYILRFLLWVIVIFFSMI